MKLQEEIDQLKAEVTRDTGVMTSATTLLNGVQARIDAAVAEAQAQGATAEQLASMQAVSDTLKANADALAAAVAANTPA